MSISLRISSLRPTQEVVTLHPKSMITEEVSEDPVGGATATTIATCHICAIHPSQYTCPRCHIPYCSVGCYQKHGSANPSSHDGAGFSCIESFYEQRVSQVLQLEVKEQSQQFLFRQQLLMNRITNNSYSSTKSDTHETLTKITEHVPLNDASIPLPVASEPLSREELVQVWAILERMEDAKNSYTTTDTDTVAASTSSMDNDVVFLQQALQQHCSIRVQQAIQQAIQNLTTTPVELNDDDEETTTHSIPHNKNINSNRTVAEWIFEPWSPWWCPNLVRFGNHETNMGSGDDFERDENHNNRSRNSYAGSRIDNSTTYTTCQRENNEPTLDERLLSVPRFDTLYSPRQRVTGRPQFPLLQFNLIDILFATVHTLHTYHGVNNILANDVAIDAATTLVSASLVLLHDRRYTNIESVLMECCNINHPMQKQFEYHNDNRKIKSTNRNTSHSSNMAFQLLHDVALLYPNHRLVARALLEASDILQAAMAEMKRTTGTTKSRSDTIKENTSGTTSTGSTNDNMRHQLRRVQKKIVFYWSWTMAVSSTARTSVVKRGWPYGHVSTDIQIWIKGWHLPSKANVASIQITV